MGDLAILLLRRILAATECGAMRWHSTAASPDVFLGRAGTHEIRIEFCRYPREGDGADVGDGNGERMGEARHSAHVTAFGLSLEFFAGTAGMALVSDILRAAFPDWAYRGTTTAQKFDAAFAILDDLIADR